MKFKFLLIAIFALGWSACTTDQINQTMGILGQGARDLKPSQGEVVAGLKEALAKGAETGAASLSHKDGFLKSAMKITFPEEAQKVESTLRGVGMGSLADKGIELLNRAAEEAAKESAPIFKAAITGMTVQDGMNILFGESNAATQYLRKTTYDQLYSKFTPVVRKKLNVVRADQTWTEITTRYNAIPFTKKVNTDITDYVAKKTIDGLFTKIAEEEGQIRKDPVERTTALLKKVFGYATEKDSTTR